MVALCDAVLVIWDGVSKGAKYTADFAVKAGKEVHIIRLEK